MKQFGFAFDAVGDPGGRFTDAPGVGFSSKPKRPKFVKVESASAKRKREKRELRARVKENGIPPVIRPAGEVGSFRGALNSDPLLLCRCGTLVRERDMVDGLCEACAYGGEV